MSIRQKGKILSGVIALPFNQAIPRASHRVTLDFVTLTRHRNRKMRIRERHSLPLVNPFGKTNFSPHGNPWDIQYKELS